MSARPAPPASAPPTGWATLTEALAVEVLYLLARHDRHPLPGTVLRNVDPVTAPLVARLARSRAQG